MCFDLNNELAMFFFLVENVMLLLKNETFYKHALNFVPMLSNRRRANPSSYFTMCVQDEIYDQFSVQTKTKVPKFIMLKFSHKNLDIIH